MGGFVISGGQVAAPSGLVVESFLDRAVLALSKTEDMRQRPAETWVRQIVLHTTKGLPGSPSDPPQPVLPGLGAPIGAGERTARYWSGDGRQAGAHLVVDFDGQISQCADLQTAAAYHCPNFNQFSIGIEIYQGRDGEVYEGQLDVVVRLCDFLTRRFGIQRQIPHRYLGPISRFLRNTSDDVVGVIGHRDAAKNRGPGDPGSAIFYRLGNARYEALDYSLQEDRETWRRRQRDLGIEAADGIPGPQTMAALRANGFPQGLWVKRPGDDEAAAVS